MFANYTQVNLEDMDWILKEKIFIDLSSIDKIAADCIFHDLNNTYMKETDGLPTRLEDDAEYSYWCDNHLYEHGEVLRVYINDSFYIYNYIYITENNRMVVVVNEVDDIWIENSEIADQIDNDKSKEIHFLVEY